MQRIVEKVLTDENKNKLANALIITGMVIVFFLIAGLAGGLESGTLKFFWEVNQ